MKAFSTFLLSLLALPLLASDTPEMADQFRADGKIYVVVTVIAIVFAGLAFWLFRLERKISQLEKDRKS